MVLLRGGLRATISKYLEGTLKAENHFRNAVVFQPYSPGQDAELNTVQKLGDQLGLWRQHNGLC